MLADRVPILADGATDRRWLHRCLAEGRTRSRPRAQGIAEIPASSADIDRLSNFADQKTVDISDDLVR